VNKRTVWIGFVIAFFAISAAILDYAANLTAVSDSLGRTLSKILIRTISREGGTTEASLTWWFAPSLLLFGISLFTLITLLWQATKTKAQGKTEATAETSRTRDKWRIELEELISALHRYVTNVKKHRPDYDVLKLHISAVIYPDGTTDWHKIVTINTTAVTQFILIQEASDNSAPPAELPSSVNLSVKPLTFGFDIEVVPTSNEPHVKEFAVFTIPPISANQEFSFEVRHLWPGFSTDIVTKGSMQTYWNVKRRKKGGTCDIMISYRFHKELCPVSAQMIGARSESGSLKGSTTVHSGDTWTYVDAVAPLVQPGYVLEFKRVGQH
jgi:hypothetical protein